jgi:hypothetical protein
MNGSPATCDEKRVHRAHSTQRSRSSRTWVEILIGLVDEQQLHDALLGLVGHRRRELGLDDHAVRHRDGARRHRLGLALHLDQTLPAGADRVQERVVAEPRHLDADQLGSADE